MPSGTLMPLSVTAAFVSSSEGCGGRNTSTCRAETCSTRTRPVNSELNDQLTRASVEAQPHALLVAQFDLRDLQIDRYEAADAPRP